MPQTAELAEICTTTDVTSSLDEVIMCIRQCSEHDRLPANVKPEGWGDCSHCAPDRNNTLCKGYSPVIVISAFYAKPSAEDSKVVEIGVSRQYIYEHPENYIG
ncbi:hypothetical protein JW968_04640 [Candidatus Woesearchaeota archaeon]|nr:hypothetical protein [Candidatus Woesearchaeota archaeon]